jgi:hypothetical protein
MSLFYPCLVLCGRAWFKKRKTRHYPNHTGWFGPLLVLAIVSDLEAAKHIELGIIMVCQRDKRRRGACLNWENMGGKSDWMVKGDVYVVYVAPAVVNRRPSNAPRCTLGRPSMLVSME